jgi:hypothetical protein
MPITKSGLVAFTSAKKRKPLFGGTLVTTSKQHYSISEAGALLVVALLAFSPCVCRAQSINLSLNLLYSDPTNSNSGGTWQFVAKASNFGIAGISTRVTGISSPTDLAPRATINGTDTAGFNADALPLIPAGQNTPAYFELDFGQAPFDPTPGEEQGAFYGVGQLTNGAPNYAGKPIGSNSEGPVFTTLTTPLNIPWATGDVFGDPTWATAVCLASGTFIAGNTPEFLVGSAGNVFTTLGTATTHGFISSATNVTTVVRTNLAVPEPTASMLLLTALVFAITRRQEHTRPR